MSSNKSKRRRGVILTTVGFQRFNHAIAQAQLSENDGDRYTLEALSDRIGIDAKTIAKVLDGKIAIDKRTLQCCFSSFNLDLNSTDFTQPGNGNKIQSKIDWGEAMDVSSFWGRTAELKTLKQWVETDHCRVIAILAMGGEGKTSLSVKFAQQLASQFDVIIWRSLRNAPPLSALLTDWQQILSGEPDTSVSLNSAYSAGTVNFSTQISQLLKQLRSQRCLLILDNWETLLQSSAGTHRDIVGQHRDGFEDYRELLRILGETSHQSCLVLTSREKPAILSRLEGEFLPVRTLQLTGLPPEFAAEILAAKGLKGSNTDYHGLIERYQGNPLALKIVATAIQDLFTGDILEFIAHKTIVFNGIRNVIDQQFKRLSELEKNLIYRLAIHREPVSLKILQSDLVLPISTKKLLEILESLGRRSLLETQFNSNLNNGHSALFTLQPVIMEYVSDDLIEQVAEEIITQTPQLFRTHALIQATAKDYVRETQIQLILEPLITELLTTLKTSEEIVENLRQILQTEQAKLTREPGYIAGNILNLLCYLKVDLTGWDFSQLNIWQAYLQDTRLTDVNFTASDLSQSVLAKTFAPITAISLSDDGLTLATGHLDGEIRLSQLETFHSLSVRLSCHTSQGFIWSVAFSSTGILASAGEDSTIKLWDITTGQCLRTLREHTGSVRTVAFAKDGNFLISGSDDRTIRVWDVTTGNCLQVLQGHQHQVWTVKVNQNSDLIASGSDDLTIKLWQIETGHCLKTLTGHTDWIRGLAFSPRTGMLASGSIDKTVKLWDIETGECLQTFRGHTNGVFSVIFINERTLASTGIDGTIRLWDIESGKCTRTLLNHRNVIGHIVASPRENLIISAAEDQTLKLWEIETGSCIRVIQARVNWIASVKFSPTCTAKLEGIIASGSEDQGVRLWDIKTGDCQTLWEHKGIVYSVAFSPDGHILASGSGDQTIRLWDIQTRQCHQIIHAHDSAVTTVEFSPDSHILASGSWDETVKFWEVKTGQLLQTIPGHFVMSVAFSPVEPKIAIAAFDQTVTIWDLTTAKCCQTLSGHKNWLFDVAFSPCGKMLASCSMDHTIRIWDVASGECLFVLADHSDWVWEVAFSPPNIYSQSYKKGILASASSDRTIKLWDLETGECIRSIEAHDCWVMSVTFSPAGETLMSGGADQVIKLWDVATGNCVQTFKTERLYERMNLTDVTGLSEAQKIGLKTLGAVF